MENDNNSQVQLDNQSNLMESTTAIDEIPINSQNNTLSTFDQVPVGGGKKFQMSQYPEQGELTKPSKTVIKAKPKKPMLKNKKQSIPNLEQQQNNKIEAKKKNIQSQNDKSPLDEVPIKPVNNFDEVPIGSDSKNTFDQVPIGKTTFQLSQFPQGQQQPQEQQTNYPMSQKLKSKAVKLRLSGFQDLLQLLINDPNSPEFSDIQIRTLLKQTNPACLQKILQCYKVWIQKDKDWGEQQAKQSMQNGYINGKPNTKKLTIQICDLMYEQKSQCVQLTILSGLKGKVPKMLAGYLAIINQLLAIYGIKKMKFLKPYLNDVIRVINTEKLAAVKTQGVNLLKQTYKWLTKSVAQPLFKDLKEAIKKQLDAFWQGYDQTTVMTAPKDTVDEQASGKPSKKIDAYQLSQAVDIFKKFNQKWVQSVLKAQKWNQKVRLMQQFISAASIPKISNTDHRHMTELIKRLINDSNFNVVLMDLKILGVLAKGLRRPFAPIVRLVFSNVIGKFRDKKTQMIDQTYNTLNQFNYCISIEDVLDDLKQGLGDKAPNMKVNLLNWIGKFVQKKIQQKGQLPEKVQQALKSLFPLFEKLLSDGTADVRDTMAKNIAKIKVLIDEDFFQKIENKMNKNLASKVSDAKQTIKVKTQSREKQKGLEKDLSRSSLVVGKERASNLSKTMQISGKKNSAEQSEHNTIVDNKGQADISNQIQRLLPKLNDNNNWQNRKDSAEALLNLINEYAPNVIIGNSVVNDFLHTLKTRINDPNKQLIKIFVNLTGLTFQNISEKEAKHHSKTFICALIEGLSDKVQANRKQISLTLNRIGDVVSKQTLLSCFGSYLQTQKQSRIQIINIILQNQQFIQRADTKDYPKGIISCLCDKNRQIRAQGQRLLQKIVQKTGFDVFRNLASQQRPAFTKDLNILFDKLQKGTNKNSSAIHSKGNSPVKYPQKSKNPPSQMSNRKTQKSLSKINKSFDRDLQLQDLPTAKSKMILVEGNDSFAPVKTLNTQRIQRQQVQQRVPWLCDQFKDNQQQELRDQISRLIRSQISSKMLSFDYKKVLDANMQLIKICKDINQQTHIRQLYDVILKWVLMRLWGGSLCLPSIIQIIPPVLSILQKKKLVLNDNESSLIVGIIRQYFISAYSNDCKVSESLYTIIKCLIILSSGQKILKKLLKQFLLDISSIHRHLKKDINLFYRNGLVKLIKSQLMQYVGNQSILQQISRIKQLKNDQQFVQLLFKRFHENVLDHYGFKSHNQEKQRSSQRISIKPDIPHPNNQSHTPNARNTNSYKSINGNSRIQQQERQLSKSRNSCTPGPTKTQRQSYIDTKDLRASRDNSELDLSIYPAPHPSSPLGKNLAKLLPPNEATINFFSALLVENGQKISNELVTHAKIIFGSILKSVMTMLGNRNDYIPQKIVTQINLLQQAIKCKHIVKNIGDLLFHATNFALTQLVYEDQNKVLIHEGIRSRGIEYKIENFIKVINGVMLRILQNASPQQTTLILFQLLIKQSKQQFPSQKTNYLIIKCVARVASNFVVDCKPQNVKDYLLQINQYINTIGLTYNLQDFNPPTYEKLKPQQNVINAIKTTLTQLCKIYKINVWTYYQKAMSQAKYPDYHIASFINSLNVPYPQKNSRVNIQNEELKRINELLSKSKTFESGIEKLKRYIDSNSNFMPIQYFTNLNYDQKFITMVMNALQGANVTYKKTPNKVDVRQDKSQNRLQAPSSEGNIQDKIKKLKMKFQQLQPRQQQNNPSTKRVQQQDRNEQRALQIKRRIDQMKSKMTSNYTRPR